MAINKVELPRVSQLHALLGSDPNNSFTWRIESVWPTELDHFFFDLLPSAGLIGFAQLDHEILQSCHATFHHLDCVL